MPFRYKISGLSLALAAWACTPASPGKGSVTQVNPASGFAGTDTQVTLVGNGFTPTLSQPLGNGQAQVGQAVQIELDGSALSTLFFSDTDLERILQIAGVTPD